VIVIVVPVPAGALLGHVAAAAGAPLGVALLVEVVEPQAVITRTVPSAAAAARIRLPIDQNLH
jgi:hypothetical protein